MGRSTTLATSMKIAEYLKANASRFGRQGLTLKQVAEEVSDLIGRPYGAPSVCRLRKHLGLDWGRRHRSGVA